MSSTAPYHLNRFNCPSKHHIRITGSTFPLSVISFQQVQLSSKVPYPFSRFNMFFKAPYPLSRFNLSSRTPYQLNRFHQTLKAPYPSNRFNCLPKLHIRLTGSTVCQSSIYIQQTQPVFQSSMSAIRFTCLPKLHIRLTISTVFQSVISV